MNKQEFMACYDEESRRLDSEIEDLKEKLSEMEVRRRVLDAAREAFVQAEKLKDELEQKQHEADDLQEQLDRQLEAKDSEIVNLRKQVVEEKESRVSAEMKLSELNKLSVGVAKKSSQDDMFKSMRSYLNISRRKTQNKREAAKMVFTELFSSAQMELPTDIKDLLEHLDDEQTEPKVVNVTGNYNDVHDNGSVDMTDKEE